MTQDVFLIQPVRQEREYLKIYITRAGTNAPRARRACSLQHSVHAAIQRQINRQTAVYDFEDLKNVIVTSRKNIKCTTLNHTNMHVFKNHARKVATTLRQLKVIEFWRRSTSMFTKHTFSDNFREVTFLKKKEVGDIVASINEGKSTIDIIETMAGPRGITSLKKIEVLRLLCVAPCTQEGVLWTTPCEQQFWGLGS